jgi:hypothetical protein
MENRCYAIDVIDSERCLWRYVVKGTGRHVLVAPPVFEIDGRPVGGALARVPVTRDAQGRAQLDMTFEQPGACLVMFGVT